MMVAPGYNPLRWDCAAQGCFNLKRRSKIELFADCFPGRINFGDVDGIVEVTFHPLRVDNAGGNSNGKARRGSCRPASGSSTSG